MEIKLLPCPLCTTLHFEGADSLRNTLVRVATNLLKCPICAESFLGLDKLTIHLFSHTECIITSKVELQDNLQEEIEKKIKNECRNVSEGPVKCDICTFSFTDKNILDIHQKLLHQTTPDLKTGNYSYHCHLCSKQFKMRGSLMVHLRVAHYGFIKNEAQNRTGCSEVSDVEVRRQNDNDGEKEGKGSEKDGQKCQDNKQWECEVCSKMFTTKYFLKKHKRLHTGEMPYCCNLCNKSFTFQQSYHKHMLYHSSDKPHTCNECGRAFKELSTLQNHARIHSGERPFVCETCGKSFRQRVSYLVHRRIHTGVMPYKCTTCDKSFRYKVSQKSHKCLSNSPPEQTITSPSMSQKTADSPIPSQNAPKEVLTIQTNHITAPNLLQDGVIVPKCIMNVDLNTGSISVIPQSHGSFTGDSIDENNTLLRKKSILLNNNGFIEISYNKTDLRSVSLNNSNDGIIGKSRNSESQDDFEKLIYADPAKELFSPTLSNLLPEVESLYLNNSPTNDLSVREHPETINDMREKCLEEFLQGMD